MRLRLLVPLCLAALLTACNDGATPCARVTCDPGYTCNATTGVCEYNDGGGGAGGGDGGQTGGGVGGGGGGTGSCDPACTSPQVCDPGSNTCVDCVLDTDCPCPTPVCTAGHTCISGLDGGFVQPTGESCLSPATLIFPGCQPVTEFTVDLSTLTDDESGSCTGAMGLGKDAVYELDLADAGDLTVTLTPAAGVQAVAYVRADPCESGQELICTQANGNPRTLKLKDLAGGTWWLIVDSYTAASSGNVDVKVTVGPPTQPSNETCGTALPLVLDDAGVATAQVDLRTADDDYSGSCSQVAPEAVYVLSLASPADLRFDMTPVSDAGTPLGVLYVRESSCTLGTELDCKAPSDGKPTVRIRAAPAGNYYVFAEAGDGGHTGIFDVTATATPASAPPPNDVCSGVRLLDPPPTNNQIDTSLDTDNYTGSCNPTAMSPEEVWQLHVTTPGTYTFTLKASSGSSASPVMYLRTLPCDFPSVVQPPPDSGMVADAGFEIFCTGPTTTQQATLPVGDYFLYVEGVGLSGAGPTDFSVTLQ